MQLISQRVRVGEQVNELYYENYIFFSDIKEMLLPVRGGSQFYETTFAESRIMKIRNSVS